MPLSSEVRSLRKKQVQRLNTLTRKHAVQQVYNGAAKSVVEALIATLETKEAVTGADKKELAVAAAQYKGSFEKSISESSSDTDFGMHVALSTSSFCSVGGNTRHHAPLARKLFQRLGIERRGMHHCSQGGFGKKPY